jgi:hypothetical protein
MKSIVKEVTVNPDALTQIKDEIFARQVKAAVPAAAKAVLREEFDRLLFRFDTVWEVSTRDKDGNIWIGNEYFRIQVHADTFNQDVINEVASQI